MTSNPSIARRLARLENDQESLYELLTEFRDENRKRLDHHDARFDHHDARFDQQDARFDQQDARFDRLDAKLDEVLGRLPGPS